MNQKNREYSLFDLLRDFMVVALLTFWTHRMYTLH